MMKLTEIFDIFSGHKLHANKVIEDFKGINLISRKGSNYGIIKKIKPISNLKTFDAGLLTFVPDGTVCSTFLQTQPFYATEQVKILKPKPEFKLSLNDLLYYASCLRLYASLFHFNRSAITKFANFKLPSLQEIPLWINKLGNFYMNKFKEKIPLLNKNIFNNKMININSRLMKNFLYKDIFNIVRGQEIKKKIGSVPYISATSKNNGVSGYTQIASFPGNQITLSNDGSIGEAFYQNKPFSASSNVFILTLKNQNLTQEIALFLCTLIKKQRVYFHYGRKWNQELMSKMTIPLPHKNGHPDWDQIQKLFIKIE